MSFGAGASALFAAAAQRLGWRPDEFWRATPAELLAAFAEPSPAPAPLDRTALQRMMEQDHE
jgi:uncharacterized phage protein (TIGR02216 family)